MRKVRERPTFSWSNKRTNIYVHTYMYVHMYNLVGGELKVCEGKRATSDLWTERFVVNIIIIITHWYGWLYYMGDIIHLSMRYIFARRAYLFFQKITIRTDSALIWLRNIIKWFSIRGRRKQIMPQCFQVECLENVLEEIFSFLYLRTNLAIKTIEFYRILFT